MQNPSVFKASDASSAQPSNMAVMSEVGRYFLRLGATGFGGPLAVVAQIEKDLVDRWISRDEFNQAFAAIKTLPGPFAFQMVVFLAYRRGQSLGMPTWMSLQNAALAAIAFLFPAMTMMIALALSRSSWASWSWMHGFLIGLQAAALGLITSSIVPLVRSSLKQPDRAAWQKWAFAFLGFAVTLIRPSLEPVIIISCGLLALAPLPTRLFAAAGTIAVPTALVGLTKLDIHTTLFMTCLKAGTLVFGSGLAIVPLLGGEFVDRLQWMTHADFLEALMFGQISPGPVMITATYIGARVAGLAGALTATLAIFIVPFIHMTTWFPRLWTRVTSSRQWKNFSFGAITAVAGALVASIIKLLEPVILAALEIDSFTWNRPVATFTLWLLLPPLAFYFIHKKKRPGWAVILAGGCLGLLLMLR